MVCSIMCRDIDGWRVAGGCVVRKDARGGMRVRSTGVMKHSRTSMVVFGDDARAGGMRAVARRRSVGIMVVVVCV